MRKRLPPLRLRPKRVASRAPIPHARLLLGGMLAVCLLSVLVFGLPKTFLDASRVLRMGFMHADVNRLLETHSFPPPAFPVGLEHLGVLRPGLPRLELEALVADTPDLGRGQFCVIEDFEFGPDRTFRLPSRDLLLVRLDKARNHVESCHWIPRAHWVGALPGGEEGAAARLASMNLVTPARAFDGLDVLRTVNQLHGLGEARLRGELRVTADYLADHGMLANCLGLGEAKAMTAAAFLFPSLFPNVLRDPALGGGLQPPDNRGHDLFLEWQGMPWEIPLGSFEGFPDCPGLEHVLGSAKPLRAAPLTPSMDPIVACEELLNLPGWARPWIEGQENQAYANESSWMASHLRRQAVGWTEVPFAAHRGRYEFIRDAWPRWVSLRRSQPAHWDASTQSFVGGADLKP